MARLPTGDQTVFSDIDVSILVFGSDFVDPNVSPNAGLVATEPALFVAVGTLVVINGGTEGGRLPGLTILGDAMTLAETSSAAATPSYGFEHRAAERAHGQSMALEFRYQGSSFSFDVAELEVAITSPVAGQVVAGAQPLLLQWSNIAQPPNVASVTPRVGSCVIAYTRVGDATFVPSRNEREEEHQPPCLFQASAQWNVGATAPPSPFASLQLTHVVRRIQRFVVH